jgi:hypothetical protein
MPSQARESDGLLPDEALRIIEESLGGISSSYSEEGRRVYLAYLAAVEARAPKPNQNRLGNIAALRQRFGI